MEQPNPLKAIALIPARLGATRFPSKLMKVIKGKTVIARTYESTLETGLFDDVIVVTDSTEIEEEIKQYGGRIFRSTAEYESGTDRIAEVAQTLDADVFLNVQGDEPFVRREPLAMLLDAFKGEKGEAVQVGSLAEELTDEALMADPNVVKVVMDEQGNSLLFSRSRIPYPRNTEVKVPCYRHIGVYAFRKEALMAFTKWPITPLESIEKIECLRFLEHGIPLRMVVTTHSSVGIDVPTDLERAERWMEENDWK